jgi:hypothetical protein
MFFQCHRFKLGQVFMWETTGHIGGYIVLGLENMTNRLVSMPSNNIKTSTISSSVNVGHLTWLNQVSAMGGHFRKWNACFSFWNGHIFFHFLLWYPPNIIIEKTTITSIFMLCKVFSHRHYWNGDCLSFLMWALIPIMLMAWGVTLRLKHLDKIHWVFGEHFKSMNGPLEKGRDVMLLLKSARNLMPASLQDFTLLMIRFKNHPLPMLHDQMCV